MQPLALARQGLHRASTYWSLISRWSRLTAPELDYAESLDGSVEAAEVIVLATEWPHFREADPKAAERTIPPLGARTGIALGTVQVTNSVRMTGRRAGRSGSWEES